MMRHRTVPVFLSSFLSLFFLPALRAQEAPPVNAAALQSGSFMVATPPSYSGTNLMLGSVENYTPEALFDMSSKLWCSESGAGFPHVFVLELTEPFMIERLGFNNICEEYEGIAAKDVRVEFAADPDRPVYRSVGEFRLESGREQEFPIAPAEARLIRISILSNHGHESFTELAEFAALGRPVMPEIRPADVDGDWQTNWGPLTFRQSGTGLQGSYEYHAGQIRYGGVNRNQITYKWVEESVDQEGWTLLFMNREGTRLTGIWCHGSDWSNYGFWIMEREKGRPFVPVTQGSDPGPGLAGKAHGVSDEVVKEMEETLDRNEALVLYGINFAVNSAQITDDSYNVLDHLARILENRTELRVRIEGHTDDVGTDQANRELSLARASAVRDYLVRGHGIKTDRLTVEGKGETTPIAGNDTEAGKAANRRVEIHQIR